jgi:hypothetical protein
MPTFSPSAQSSSEIAVSWNVEDVDPGYDFIALSITQTDPNGHTTVQNPPPDGVVQIGTTYFSNLKPSTTYTYVIYAAWDDGNGGVGATYNPQPGTPCTTNAEQPATGGSKGAGSGSTSSAPPELGPITGLTAKWNAPDYNQVTVDFTAGANSTTYHIQLENPAATYNISGIIYRNPVQPPADTVPVSYTFPNVKPGAYTITATEAYESQTKSATYSLTAPPPPPTMIVGALWNDDYTAVTLVWRTQGSGTTPTSMTLQRYTGAISASATPSETVQIPLAPPYTDTPPNITSTSQYQYELTASNAFGQTSASSNLLSPPTAPAAPTNLVAEWSVKYSQVKVTWAAADHADSYEVVLFKTEGDGPLQSILQKAGDYPNITSTTFTGPLAGQDMTEYQYQVIAHNRFGSNASVLSNGLLTPPASSNSTSTSSSSSSVDPTHKLVSNKAP